MDNEKPHLTARLALVASFVRNGAKIADIGTDHAYVPVFLVNSGISPCAVASDVKSGPLERAVCTARTYGADQKMKFILTDGLDKIEPNSADDIIIAGMGGELIAAIIGRCEWLKDPAKHLILQPMTSQEELRWFLCENGYAIEKESVAKERHGQKLYVVMSVYYSGKIRKIDTLYSYVGELALTGGKNGRDYLENKAKLLEKKAAGLSHAKNNNTNEAQEARILAQKIKEVCENMAV